MSCGVDCRRGLDPALLWLWCRPVATALIGPLAWEPPYAMGVALEKAKRPKEKEKAFQGVSFVAQQLRNPNCIHEDVGSIPGLTQCVKDLVLLSVVV